MFTWGDFIAAHVSGLESRGPPAREGITSSVGRLLGSAALRMILDMRAIYFLRNSYVFLVDSKWAAPTGERKYCIFNTFVAFHH